MQNSPLNIARRILSLFFLPNSTSEIEFRFANQFFLLNNNMRVIVIKTIIYSSRSLICSRNR